MNRRAPKLKTGARIPTKAQRDAARLKLNAKRLLAAVSSRELPEEGRWPLPPGAHPDAFGLKIVGNCLAPRALESQVVLVEPTMPQPGELAVFFFKGGGLPTCKVLSKPIFGYPLHPESECIPVAEVEQLNPPKRYHVPLDKIEAIGRVHSVIDSTAAVDNSGKIAAGLI